MPVASYLAPIEMQGSSPLADSLQLGEPVGLARIDSALYAFDAADPSVRVFDLNLLYRGKFLRSGRGPGEMTAFRSRAGSAIPDYIVSDADRLILLDYNADQTVAYSEDGKYIATLTRGHFEHVAMIPRERPWISTIIQWDAI
jgi:hypothetical protein